MEDFDPSLSPPPMLLFLDLPILSLFFLPLRDPLLSLSDSSVSDLSACLHNFRLPPSLVVLREFILFILTNESSDA